MKEQLSKYLIYITENSGHWTFRCPYCGDSKNSKKGHFNVAKDKPVFRCVRCGQGGHIKALLQHLDIRDIILPEYTTATSYVKKIGSTKITMYTEPIDDFMKEYITLRLQTNIIPEELKIISLNTLQNLVKQASFTFGNQPIFSQCIPFLSYRNRKINARILNNDKFRYYIYSLQEGSDYYIINNKRRYSQYRKHNTVVIAEGPFDIASQYIHRFVDTPDDAVYMAANNQTFNSALNVARSVSLCYNPNVVLLTDSDVPSKVYVDKLSKFQFKSLKIYKNKVGKDFGDLPVESFLDLEVS